MSTKTVTRGAETDAKDVSTRDLFASLEGQDFRSYRDFDRAVQKALERYRSAFLLTYTPRQAITWARQNGWIEDSDKGLRVKLR
jgi:hypothetical protein